MTECVQVNYILGVELATWSFGLSFFFFLFFSVPLISDGPQPTCMKMQEESNFHPPSLHGLCCILLKF